VASPPDRLTAGGSARAHHLAAHLLKKMKRDVRRQLPSVGRAATQDHVCAVVPPLRRAHVARSAQLHSCDHGAPAAAANRAGSRRDRALCEQRPAAQPGRPRQSLASAAAADRSARNAYPLRWSVARISVIRWVVAHDWWRGARPTRRDPSAGRPSNVTPVRRTTRPCHERHAPGAPCVGLRTCIPGPPPRRSRRPAPAAAAACVCPDCPITGWAPSGGNAAWRRGVDQARN
jgi:hypothetical protein